MTLSLARWPTAIFVIFFGFVSARADKTVLLDKLSSEILTESRLKHVSTYYLLKYYLSEKLWNLRVEPKVAVTDNINQIRSIWEKSFNDQELDYIVKLSESTASKRFGMTKNKLEMNLRESIRADIKKRFKEVVGLSYYENVNAKELSWLTRALWKVFPESNRCPARKR